VTAAQGIVASKVRCSAAAASSGATSARRREEQQGGKTDFASACSAEDKSWSYRAHVRWHGHRGVVETGGSGGPVDAVAPLDVAGRALGIFPGGPWAKQPQAYSAWGSTAQ
jgi:hypothetical protein